MINHFPKKKSWIRFGIIMILAGLICLVGVGCEGEQGLAGTSGTQGDDGRDGRNGVNGRDGVDGLGGSQGPAGPIYWQGTFSLATAYVVGDAVSYLGSSYICKLQSTGLDPTNGTYWDIISQKGTDGEAPDWDGGQVTDLATFNGGSVFPSGTVTNLNGSTYLGGNLRFLEGATIEWESEPGANENWMRIYKDGIKFQTSEYGLRTVDIDANSSAPDITLKSSLGAEAYLKAGGGGDARLELSSSIRSGAVYMEADVGDGGGGRLRLRNGAGVTVFDFDANTGKISGYNSAGNVTVEFDAQTGNVYYTGELKKK